MAHNRSIRRTLWTYLALLSLAALIALFFAARAYGQREGNRAYDHLLISSALSILEHTALVGDEWQLDLPYSALSLLAIAPDDRVFYRVFAADGRKITGDQDLPAPPATHLPGQVQLFDAPWSGELVRFAVARRQMASPSAQGEVIVQVGQTRLAREALAADIITRALAVIVALTLLWLPLVALGIHRALRPLRQIEHDLSRRAPSDLNPLTTPAPAELRQLVSSLNRFMTKLSESHTAMRAFMGEAAHQMRTPLAAIRAQAQAGQDELDDPPQMHKSLVTIDRNTAHMTRLLNQMLSDASVAHRAQAQRFETIDLTNIIRDVAAQTSPLTLRLPDAPALLHGERLLLSEALKNLIDNASKYGQGRPIEVSLSRNGAMWEVCICDHGPGIPVTDLERIFERFTRGNTAIDGAGLGLAIVRRVALSHGGQISLNNRDGGGLTAALRLPGIFT